MFSLRGVALADMPERVISGLTISIDRDLCVGFGDCMENVIEVFEFDDDGIIAFQKDVTPVDRDALIEACACCPVDALIVLNEEGQQLAP